MLDLLFFILLIPAFLMWAVYRVLADIVQFFGGLLGPAVLSLYGSAVLFIVGPSAPDAVFESVFQALSGTLVLGVRLPWWLLFAGVVMLAIRPSCRFLRAMNSRPAR